MGGFSPVDPLLVPFGQEIRRLRAERGLSRRQLARAMGYPKTRVQIVEEGRRATNFRPEDFARALGVSVESLPPLPPGALTSKSRPWRPPRTRITVPVATPIPGDPLGTVRLTEWAFAIHQEIPPEHRRPTLGTTPTVVRRALHVITTDFVTRPVPVQGLIERMHARQLTPRRMGRFGNLEPNNILRAAMRLGLFFLVPCAPKSRWKWWPPARYFADEELVRGLAGLMGRERYVRSLVALVLRRLDGELTCYARRPKAGAAPGPLEVRCDFFHPETGQPIHVRTDDPERALSGLLEGARSRGWVDKPCLLLTDRAPRNFQIGAWSVHERRVDDWLVGREGEPIETVVLGEIVRR